MTSGGYFVKVHEYISEQMCLLFAHSYLIFQCLQNLWGYILKTSPELTMPRHTATYNISIRCFSWAIVYLCFTCFEYGSSIIGWLVRCVYIVRYYYDVFYDRNKYLDVSEDMACISIRIGPRLANIMQTWARNCHHEILCKVS